MSGVGPLVGRLLTMPRGRLLLLAEACWFLALSSAAVAVLPFRRSVRLGGANERLPVVGPADAVQVESVRGAVEGAAPRLPFRAKCFERALAARLMLRRRGIGTTLYYGARMEGDSALSAHVWLRSGETDVIGCENASAFQRLSQFA
jgi:hypothetical protein